MQNLAPSRALASVLSLALVALGAAGCGGAGSASTADSGVADTEAQAADTGRGEAGGGDANGGDSTSPTDTGSGTGDGAAPEAGEVGPVEAGGDATPVGTGDAGQYIPGAPLTAPANTWTWVDFPEALCANGTSTGLGVNLSSTAGSRVLIYLEGGGACWDALTCYTLQTASYFTTGYGPTDFAAESADVTYLAEPGGFFDRTAAANPFKDYSYVYVPYCTGDVFAGNNVASLGGMTADFVGARNIVTYLDRIVPTFPSAPRVYLAGSSAGGFGALVNWGRTQQAFGSIPVHLIDDSGTLMPPDVLAMSSAAAANMEAEQAAWNINANLPPGCTGCGTRLDDIWAYYATAFPHQKASLLSYTADTVLPTFYGLTTAEFTMGLDEEIMTMFEPTTNLKYFTFTGAGHVLWFTPSLTTNGVTVQQFLTLMVNDDPTWTSEE